jgi:hypothetical protein
MRENPRNFADSGSRFAYLARIARIGRFRNLGIAVILLIPAFGHLRNSFRAT